MHVGHALGRQGVAAQVGKCAAVVQARRLLQLGKHADETTRVITRIHQNAIAHAVCFAFHVSGVAQLGLNRCRLTAHNQGLGGLRAFAGRQGAQNHRAHHPRRHLGLVAHAAGNVPLRHMAQLMGQHRSQFIGRAHHGHQTQMDAQITTRQCESVHRTVSAQQNPPGKALLKFRRQLAACHSRPDQRRPKLLDVLVQYRIFQIIRVTKQFACDAVPQLALRAQGNAVPIAQCRQADGLAAGRAHTQAHGQDQPQRLKSSISVFQSSPRHIQAPYDARLQ